MNATQAYSIATGVFALDRLTKWVIETRMSYLETITVIPGFFDIVYARNPGASFSLFADSASPWRTSALIAIVVVAVVVVGLMLRKVRELDKPTAIGLSLILGGALGNGFDRIRYGAVTDFLDFYLDTAHWPAFNVADTAIVCGGALLLLGMRQGKREAART